MKILALLPGLLLLWPTYLLIKKGWRLFVLLCLAGMIGGCASSSNRLDKSPCACQFKPLNAGHLGEHVDA